MPRDWRRRLTPQRAAKPDQVLITPTAMGVWLDVRGKAGILFTPEQWGRFCLEACALLSAVTDSTSPT